MRSSESAQPRPSTLTELKALLSKSFIDGSTLNITSEQAGDVSSTLQALLSNTQIFPQAALQMNLTSGPKLSGHSLVLEGNLSGEILTRQPLQGKAVTIPQRPYQTIVTFSLDAKGVVQAEIFAQMPPAWQINQAFTVLHGTELGDVSWGEAGFVAATTSANGYVQGLNFFGPLPGETLLFAPVLAFFEDAGTHLPLKGAISLPKDPNTPPIFDVKTDVTKAHKKIGELEIAVQVSASTNFATKRVQAPVKLTGSIKLECLSEELVLSATLTGGYTTKLSASIVEGNKLQNGLSDLNGLSSGSVFSSVIPSDFALGNDLAMETMEITLVYDGLRRSAGIVSVGVGVALAPKQPWEVIPHIIEISKISVRFTVHNPFHNPQLTATVAGSFDLGSPDQGPIDVALSFPNITVSGGLTPGKEVDLSKFIAQIFAGHSPPGSDLKINELNFLAIPGEKTYSFRGGIKPVPPLTIPGLSNGLEVTELKLALDRQQTRNQLFFQGNILFLKQSLALTASKSGSTDAHWTFAGQLTKPAKMADIVTELVPKSWGVTKSNLPALIKDLTIHRLGASFTPHTHDYVIDADFGWDFKLGEATYDIEASIHLQSSKNEKGKSVYSGEIAGHLDFNGLTLALIYEFAPNSKKIIFQYEQLTVTYAQDPKTDPTFTIAFGNSTLADLINFMVELFDKGSKIHFPSPWDKLLDINLNGLTITIHTKTKEVTVEYMHDFDFVFLDFQGFSLSYTKQYGKSKFAFNIFGSFFGQKYTKSNPLTWDPVNGSPPSTAPRSKSLEILYFGLGQHVTFKEPPGDSVAVLIEHLKQALLPPVNPTQNPVTAMPDLVFDADSKWMLGGQFIIDRSFRVSVIFNDPTVYGLLIEVDGPAAKSLQGLKFEIVYRKISKTLGVYHIDFALPTEFRNLQFGEVAIVLPDFVIDIFTNGNFKIDIGFPPSLTNFKQSFSVQVFPFIGFGGFYFGVLNGQSSSSVPKISNGSFDPVIELGFALSVGLGKTINEGILSGGAYITVVGQMCGTFATFHPSENNQPTETYYDITGTIGIVGKVFGSINFVVIKASVSLTVFADVQIEIASHEPILISLTAGVRVSASIKVLFVTLHFHFHTTIHESFTIGHQTQTPWRISKAAHKPSEQQASNDEAQLVMRQQPAQSNVKLMHRALGPTHVMRNLVHAHPLNQTSPGAGAPAPAHRWQRSQQAFAQPAAFMELSKPLIEETVAKPRPIDPSPLASGKDDTIANLEPVVSMAKREMPLASTVDLPVQPPSGQKKTVIPVWITPIVSQGVKGDFALNDDKTPVTTLTPMLTIQTSCKSDGQTVRSVVQGAGVTSPFDVLLRGLFAWAQRQVIGMAETISVLELLDIKHALSDPQKVTALFGADQISTYLNDNFVFDLKSVPKSKSDTWSVANFPVPPYLKMSWADSSGKVTPLADFQNHREVGNDYEQAIDLFFDQMMADYANEVEKDPHNTNAQLTRPTIGARAGSQQSFAAYMFDSYFVMILKQLTQHSIELLTRFPLELGQDTSSISLHSIAESFPQTEALYKSVKGDCVASIAEISGVTEEVIEEANPDIGDPIPPGTMVYVPLKVSVEALLVANWKTAKLASDQSLTLSGVTHPILKADTLDTISTLYGGDTVTPLSIADANATQVDLFKSGTDLLIGEVSFTTSPEDTAQSIANYYGKAAAATVVLEPGITLTLPANLDYTTTTTQTPGADTLAAIAVANKVSAKDFSAFYADVLAHNDAIEVRVSQSYKFTDISLPIEGTGFFVPYQIQSGDTIDGVLARYFPNAGTREARGPIEKKIKQSNPDQDLWALQAGNTLSIPYAFTLQNIAIYYDLGWSPGAPTGCLGTMLAKETDIFSDLAVLNIPPFQVKPDIGETFASLAQSMNLTAAEINNTLAHQVGILAKSQTIEIPHVPTITVDALQEALIGQGAFNNAANMATRFFLHGMRLPDPADAKFKKYIKDNLPIENAGGLKTYPLYALSGQMFEVMPNFASIEFAASPSKSAPWIKFNGSASGSLSIVPKELQTNINNFQKFPFKPGVEWIQPDPGYLNVPRRHILRHSAHWQVPHLPAGLEGNGQKTADLTLWPLPESLITRVQNTGVTHIEIESARRTTTGQLDVAPVAPVRWATTIEIDLQKLPKPTGETTAPKGSYLLEGTDHEGMKRITDILGYVGDQDSAPGVQLHLLYAPNSTTANPSGYVSVELDSAKTAILRTNLSTLTGVAGPREQGASILPAQVAPIAQLSQSAPFLRMIYEASAVRSGGFYFSYYSAAGRAGLPKSLFKAGDSAKVQLLVLIDEPTTVAAPFLQSFHNVALVGENLDTAHAQIYATQPARQVGQSSTIASLTKALGRYVTAPADLVEANKDVVGIVSPGFNVGSLSSPHFVRSADTFGSLMAGLGVNTKTFVAQFGASSGLLRAGAFVGAGAHQLQAKPSLPPGHIGFSLARTEPVQKTDQGKLDALFNLLSFHIEGSGGFVASMAGLPAGPLDEEALTQDGLPPVQYEDGLWLYHHSLNVAQFADPTAAIAPRGPALPSPTLNPYRGTSASASASLSSFFRDIFGNQPASTQPNEPVNIKVRYTDDIVSPSSWPGVSGSFLVHPNGNGAQLGVSLTASAAQFIPKQGYPFKAAHASARAAKTHARKIWFQLQSITADIDVPSLGRLSSTRENGSVASDTKQLLLDCALQNFLFLDTLSQAEEVQHTATAGQNLAKVASQYTCTVGDVLTANPEAALFNAFGAVEIKLPVYAMVSNQSVRDFTQGSAAALSALAARNPDARLTAGVAVKRPKIDVVVQSDTTQTVSLSQIARDHSTPVAQLASSNPDVILRQGLTLKFAYHYETAGIVVFEVKTGPGDKLSSMAITLQNMVRAGNKKSDSDAEVSVADVAVANEQVSGLFPGDTELTIDYNIIPEDAQLLAFAEGLWDAGPASGQKLLDENQDVAGLFQHGIGLLHGSMSYTLQEADTPTTLATEHRLEISDLGELNAQQAFVASVDLAIPYQIRISKGQQGFSAYRPSGSETLAAIVALYSNWSIGDCASLNQDITGLFAPGVNLSANGKQYHPTLTDTPATVAKALGFTGSGSVEQLLNDLLSQPNIWRPGATLLAPTLKADATLGDTVRKYCPFASSPSALAAEIESMAQINGPLAGLLAGDSTVTYPGLITPLKTQANETLTGLATRVNHLLGGHSVTPGALALANPDIQLNPINLISTPGQSQAAFDLNVALDSPCCPLNVMMKLSRNQDDVAKAFQGSHVETTHFAFNPAPIGPDRQHGQNLNYFAALFESALPGLKIASGPKQSDARHTPLWLVNFAPSLGPDYSFAPKTAATVQFSVPPLSNTVWIANDVSLKTYSGGATLGMSQKNIGNGRPDVWARQLLAMIDRVMAPDYALAGAKIAPKSLESLIKSKEEIANAYAAHLIPIFVGKQGNINSARETLRQSMLRQLSTVYEMESIVQVPFDTANGGTTASRLLAVPKARIINIATNTSISNLAKALDVAPLYLADVLLDQPNIVAPNVKLSFKQQTYTTRETDTLASILAVPEFGAAKITAQDLVVGVTPSTFLAQNSVINATLVRSDIEQNTTLTGEAELYDMLPAELMLANAANVGLFELGTEIILPGHTKRHKVIDGDNPALIAAAFDFSIEDFANSLWRIDISKNAKNSNGITAHYKLSPGGQFNLIKLQPQYSITASGLPMIADQSAANFVFSVKQAEDESSVVLDLDLSISAIETQIEQNPVVPGYDNSLWLHFIRPISADNDPSLAKDLRLGLLNLAVPLREYPDAGSIGRQQVLADDPNHSNLTVVDWSYQVDLKHAFAAQDEVSLELLINASPEFSDDKPQGKLESVNPLYQALASVNGALDNLKQDLAALSMPTLSGKDATGATNALAALSILAEDVVQHFNAENTRARLNDTSSVSEHSYKFQIRAIPSEGDIGKFDALVISSDPQNQARLIFGFGYGPANIAADIKALSERQLPKDLEAAFDENNFALSVSVLVLPSQNDQKWAIVDNTGLATYEVALDPTHKDRFLVWQTYFWPKVLLPSAPIQVNSIDMLNQGQCPVSLRKENPNATVRTLVQNHEWLVDCPANGTSSVLTLAGGTKGALILDRRQVLTTNPKSGGGGCVQLDNTLLINMQMPCDFGAITDLTFMFETLMVLAEQNAASASSVIRNFNLSPYETTDSQFIYRSAVAKVPNPIAASLVNRERHQIAGDSLAEALVDYVMQQFEVLVILDPNADRFVSLSGSYERILNASEDAAIAALFPLTMTTAIEYAVSAPPTFVQDFVTELEEYAKNSGVPVDAGGFKIEMKVFGKSGDKPGNLLLDLQDIYYSLSTKT